MVQLRHAVNDFDARAMHAAMDTKRIELGFSWRQVADAIWAQSDLLNVHRRDHPISPSTLTGVASRGDCTCQHALFILRWLDRSPESFLSSPCDTNTAIALPSASRGERLRWNLKALAAALDEQRHARGPMWRELAKELDCTEHQLTGNRTAKYAIGMKLAMRIVQWLGRPAAAFIVTAHW